jgi:hypothetical protein
LLSQVRPAAHMASGLRSANDAKRRRSALLAAYVRLGADWNAVIALAAELGRPVRGTAERLREAGADLPDGRFVSRLRLGQKRPPKPKVLCRFPGCIKDAIRRGCCNSHRRFAYANPESPINQGSDL